MPEEEEDEPIPSEVIERITRVARLAAEGMAQRKIAETLGISQPTVCGDLKRARALKDNGTADSAHQARISQMARLARTQPQRRSISAFTSSNLLYVARSPMLS
jgi:DNA-binding CsgD family transcriptional regulator